MRGGALGDFLLTLPALTALRRCYPGSHISVITYSRAAFLAQSAGIINNVTSLDRAEFSLLFEKNVDASDFLRKYFRDCDLVINYLNDPLQVSTANIRQFCSAEFIILEPFPKLMPAWQFFAKPLLNAGLIDKYTPARLNLPASIQIKGVKHLKDLPPGIKFAIHPGSGSKKKNWALSNYLELAHILKGKGFSPFFITGEADRDIFKNLMAIDHGYRLFNELALEEISGILMNSAHYIGNDSGITHLAGVIGIPSIALFGPTDPSIWAPPGEHVKVVSTADPESTYTRIIEQIDQAFSA